MDPPVDDGVVRVKGSAKKRTAGVKLRPPTVALQGMLGMDSDTEADLCEESVFGSDLDLEDSSEEEENWHLVGGDVPHRHSKRGIGGR